MILAVNLIYQL